MDIEAQNTPISPHNFVCIEVKDTGIGIAQENIEKIFNQSIQIVSYQNQDGKGSGLDISIVKKLWKNIKGKLGH